MASICIDANSKPQSAGISNAEDVLNEIKRWIQSDENPNFAKFYGNAVDHMKSKVERDNLFCLETTLVERQYVKTVLEMWLRESLKKAFAYLTDEKTDISMEMSTILNELNLIKSFEDIRSNLDGATSRLKEWCDGDSSHFQCRYFQLIIDQRDLFSTMPRFTILVSSYLNQFKTSCTEKIFARCLDDITKDETSGEKNLNFIFSLMKLFEIANEDIRIQNILEANITEFYVTDDKQRTGRDFIKKILEIMENCSTAIGRQLPEWFVLMNPETEWTRKLDVLSKEMNKKLSAVKTEIKIKDEYGRKIIFVYGVAIFISKIVKEMLQLKGEHPDVQEIQIIGLASIHVNNDLESKDWHGINVGIVTNKLCVDADEVCWNVSGKNGNDKVAEGHGTDQAGESGGNVHVICNEMINAERWTIICDGGDGSDALNGGDGEIKPDGNVSRKWSNEKFRKFFPSMSTFDTGEDRESSVAYSKATVLDTIEKILPKENRTRQSCDIHPQHKGGFFVEGTATDGSIITVSYYESISERQTFIMCKGSKFGSGGYGGTITLELLDAGKIKTGVPFIGKEKREVTTVRMDVYEAKGFDGKTGKAVGDVGFIHNLDTSLKSARDNLVGNYIGFENDVNLKITINESKPKGENQHNTYAKLKNEKYGSIIPCEKRDFNQMRPGLNVVKKNAIIHQSLAQHLATIEERKQMTQSMKKILCNPMGHELNNIDELVKQTELKEAQLHQLMSQSSRRMEKIGAVKYVKPALKRNDHFSIRGSVGRRPVDSRTTPTVEVRCLDVLPTVRGVNSALNSIFGRLNSKGSYLCNNTRTFRRRLAQFIRNIENKSKVLAVMEHFVLRMKRVDELDFPITCGLKSAYVHHQNGEDNLFNWEKVANVEELCQEYAKFVELPSSALDLSEVKMLAEMHNIKIHVYEDQLTSFKFKESFNPSGGVKKHFLLYEGDGEWQRLQANENLQFYCQYLDEIYFECKPIQIVSFQNLIEWLEKNSASQQLIDSMRTLNPEYGDTPDELFRILIWQNSIPIHDDLEAMEKTNKDLMEKLAPELGLLFERVLQYNRRNISPIFYLKIVNEFVPKEWKYEFALLELNQLLTKTLRDGEVYDWEESMIKCMKKIDEKMPFVLSLIQKNLVSTENCSAWEPHKLLRFLQMLEEECSRDNNADIISERELSELPLNNWFYELRSNVWKKKIYELSVNQIKISNDIERLKEEVTFILLELEYKNGEEFCNELINGITNMEAVSTKLQTTLYPGKNNQMESNQKSLQRNVEDIVSSMGDNIPEKEHFPKVVLAVLEETKEIVELSKSKEIKSTVDDKSIKKLIVKWQKNGLELTKKEELVQFLCVYDYAVQKIFTKKGDEKKFQLYDTQRVTIMTLLKSTFKKKATFTQVSTGEGKSLIVAGIAIAFALSRIEENTIAKNKKVDIITSNDVLALRDSNLSVADGGLKDLYEFFNISVANNSSQSTDKRILAYNASVVYGQLANFQRDYLLDEFYDRNIRQGRTMDLVIVDEVDCMLLDRGNNTLYLSHDIPGMEMLESLYIFIWEKLRTSFALSDKWTMKESIKAAVLYDLYGTITKDDLESIHSSLKDQPSKKNALWDQLIETKVIDPRGRLLKNIEEIDKIKYEKDLNPKIVFYCRKVAERERFIQIPEHLMHFVDRHLDSWLDNAFKTLEFTRDEDYVVDQDRTDTSPDLNPQVIIIDQDTGTDQISSQWDGALHQFIQLKEGCKLTQQSLKAIFISNATYIQKYRKIAGVSGTLGSQIEQNFMREKYKCFFFTVPTAFQKQFHLKPTKVLKSKLSWVQAIIDEAEQTVASKEGDNNRSLVIFCESIKDANTVHHYIKAALASKIGLSHIHCYTRDYEKFVFESASLQVGHVIIATNLAGRGTDIKISQQLRDNGGLHICLTFLPKNERIEEQAMGRSARNGAPGSGIFVLCDESASVEGIKCGLGNFFTLKEERKYWEQQRISRLVADFRTIEREEVFSEDLLQHYFEVKNKLKNRKCQDQEIQSICDSILDKWALWLDETVEYLEMSFSYYMKDFEKDFIPGLNLTDNDLTDISWITPVRSIALAKYLATQKDDTKISKAAIIFDRLINSKDSYWYPAVYYYRAFILLKEDLQENKNRFIATLRTFETILNQHIEMQMNFYRKVNHTVAISDKTITFCIVEGYKQQKNNTVQLLEYFIGSSRSLLGSHYCSASDLKEAGSDPPEEPGFLKKIETFIEKKKSLFRSFEKKDKNKSKNHKIFPSKVDKIFQSLIEVKCIVCQLNSEETVPNRTLSIQRIADQYRFRTSLEKELECVFRKSLNENEIEKELKNIKPDLIPCTRKTFWDKLVEEKALFVLEDGICPEMKCVIMLDSECDVEPTFNRKEAIEIDLASSGYVLYNPTYTSRKNLLQQKKIMFRKEYIKNLLLKTGYQKYCDRKKNFEFNYIARIDFEKLKTVNLTSFGRLGLDDFFRVNIIPQERQAIWDALKSQQIIDENGNLSLQYTDQKFNYPDCPAYEDAVMQLLGRTFVAEIVRRHWLKSKEDISFLKAINLLPMKPYRDMLGDLMAAHVISGARVTDDANINLKEEVKKIKGTDEEEQKCIVDFLIQRQAIYAAPRLKKYDIVLKFIERDVRLISEMNNVSTELYDFGLVGFDHVINVKDRVRSWKTVCVTTLISTLVIAGGGTSVGVGVFLIYNNLLAYGFCKNLLFMAGLSDVLFAVMTILTRRNFPWADYGRQKIRSIIGKAEPIEMIKHIWELYNSSEKPDEELRNRIRKSAELRWGPASKKQQIALNQTSIDKEIIQLRVDNHTDEFYFHYRIHSQGILLLVFLIEKINTLITKNSTEINKTLSRFYRSNGQEEAQRLTDAKIFVFTTSWFTNGCKWVSEVEYTINSKLTEIGKNRKKEKMQFIEKILEDMRPQMVRQILKQVQAFILDLGNDPLLLSATFIANHVDDEEIKRFKKRAITDIKAELARKAEVVEQLMTKGLHQIASDHITQLAKINPKLYAAFL